MVFLLIFCDIKTIELTEELSQSLQFQVKHSREFFYLQLLTRLMNNIKQLLKRLMNPVIHNSPIHLNSMQGYKFS